MTIINSLEWNNFLANHPDAHVLQTSAWGELKSAFNWEAQYFVSGAAGAQILFRNLPLGFSVAYIPKGPVGSDWNRLWPEIDEICRSHNAIFLKVEPDLFEPEDLQFEKEFNGFVKTEVNIQPRRTIVVDLSGSEEDWLKRMKQKTRYNIRLAQKKDIEIKQVDDLKVFQNLMEVTGERDGFGVHSIEYYQKAFDLFSPSGKCALLVAAYHDEPLAALMVFAQGKRAWYFYGASNNEHRNRMPTYLLQWEAMRWAKAMGCEEYDLWGVPDFSEDQLEQDFQTRSDGLWGVYRFKRGFGGEVLRSAGSWDRIYKPMLYRIYQWREKYKNSQSGS